MDDEHLSSVWTRPLVLTRQDKTIYSLTPGSHFAWVVTFQLNVTTCQVITYLSGCSPWTGSFDTISHQIIGFVRPEQDSDDKDYLIFKSSCLKKDIKGG